MGIVSIFFGKVLLEIVCSDGVVYLWMLFLVVFFNGSQCISCFFVLFISFFF